MDQPGQQLMLRDPFQSMMFPFGGMSPFGNMFQNMVSACVDITMPILWLMVDVFFTLAWSLIDNVMHLSKVELCCVYIIMYLAYRSLILKSPFSILHNECLNRGAKIYDYIHYFFPHRSVWCRRLPTIPTLTPSAVHLWCITPALGTATSLESTMPRPPLDRHLEG